MSKEINPNLSTYLTIILVIILVLIAVSLPIEQITTHIENSGAWAPLIYILVCIIGQVFAPVSTTPINIAGIFLFKEHFYYYTLFTDLVVSFLNYYIAKRWGRKLVKRLVTQPFMDDIDKIVLKINTVSLLFVRILAMPLNDFASYAFGLADIDFKKYFTTTIIANILWILVWKYGLANFTGNIFIFIIAFIALMAPIMFVVKGFFKIKK